MNASQRLWSALTAACLVLTLGTPALWFTAQADATQRLEPSADGRGPAASQSSVATVRATSTFASVAASLAAEQPTVPAAPAVPVVNAMGIDARSPEAMAQRPVRVTIASVGIDAVVRPVGIARDGQMALPQDPDKLGWYRYGPSVGAVQGRAVLAGHVDSRTQGLGQLSRLASISEGALIDVTVEGGEAGPSRVTYRVTDAGAVAKSRLDLGDTFRRDGAHELLLITCGGEFRPDAGGYEDNVIVTAVPIDRATP